MEDIEGKNYDFIAIIIILIIIVTIFFMVFGSCMSQVLVFASGHPEDAVQPSGRLVEVQQCEHLLLLQRQNNVPQFSDGFTSKPFFARAPQAAGSDGPGCCLPPPLCSE